MTTEHPHLGGKIPEMRLGMRDMRWTVVISDWSGWLELGTWKKVPDEDVANWTEIGPAVDATKFQEELYNRAVTAENALTRHTVDPATVDLKAELRRLHEEALDNPALSEQETHDIRAAVILLITYLNHREADRQAEVAGG